VAGGRNKKKKNGPKKIKRAPRKIIKITSPSSFTSVTIQQPTMSVTVSTEIASVSSESDIFAHRPIQTSVLETRLVAYEPIAPVDKHDLLVLIPADNDTYIDLDIKLYVRVN